MDATVVTALIGGIAGIATAGGTLLLALGTLKIRAAKAHALTAAADTTASQAAAVVWRDTIAEINRRLAECETDRKSLFKTIEDLKIQHARDIASLQASFFELMKEHK